MVESLSSAETRNPPEVPGAGAKGPRAEDHGTGGARTSGGQWSWLEGSRSELGVSKFAFKEGAKEPGVLAGHGGKSIPHDMKPRLKRHIPVSWEGASGVRFDQRDPFTRSRDSEFMNMKPTQKLAMRRLPLKNEKMRSNTLFSRKGHKEPGEGAISKPIRPLDTPAIFGF